MEEPEMMNLQIDTEYHEYLQNEMKNLSPSAEVAK